MDETPKRTGISARLAEFLRSVRRRKNIRQKDMAIDGKLSTTTISHAESGRSGHRALLLARYFHALGAKAYIAVEWDSVIDGTPEREVFMLAWPNKPKVQDPAAPITSEPPGPVSQGQ